MVRAHAHTMETYQETSTNGIWSNTNIQKPQQKTKSTNIIRIFLCSAKPLTIAEDIAGGRRDGAQSDLNLATLHILNQV